MIVYLHTLSSQHNSAGKIAEIDEQKKRTVIAKIGLARNTKEPVAKIKEQNFSAARLHFQKKEYI